VSAATVLLVEDDASLREVMAFQLQSAGYHVEKAPAARRRSSTWRSTKRRR